MADIDVVISSGSIMVVELNRGLSGYSGKSGFSGYSGANPGASGYSGYSGKSGYSGISGKSGYSGASGFSGYSGRSAYSGYSGISGFSGYSGTSGKSGFSGYSGTSKSMIGSVPASSGSNPVVGASSTAYASAFNANYGTSGANFFSATESLRQVRVPFASTLRSFYLDTNGAQPGDGALVVTVRKNGVDTALTLTVASGAAAGGFSDTTHSVSFSAGDLLSIGFVNAATASCAVLTSFSLEVDSP